MNRQAAAVATVLLAVATVDLSGWLRPLDNALSDLRFPLAERAASGGIAVVDIDAKSLAAIGRWPLPRRIYGDAIDRLRSLGAAEIAFDIDFSSPSTGEDDAALEAALERAGDSVILATFHQPLTAGGSLHANRPLARFARHAWLACVNVELDPDGKVRRLAYGGGAGPDTIPSLAALLGGGAAPSGREFYVDFGIDAGTVDRLPLIDVLDGKIDRRRIDGRKIIVAAQAVELRDDFLVPRFGILSGGLLQALGVETIAAGRALHRTSHAATGAGLLMIALVGFLLRRRQWRARLAAIGSVALAIEALAILVQRVWPLEVMTGAWQLLLVAFAVLTLLGEIDLRRILVIISRSETTNTQAILGRVIADSYAAVLIFDAGGTVIAASRSAVAMLRRGVPLVGTTPDILPAALATIVRQTLAVAKSGTDPAGQRGEITWRNGPHDMTVEYVVTPSRLDGGIDRNGVRRAGSHAICLTCMDVTERRRAGEKISYLARFDALTGLANRNQLVEGLERALAGVRDDGKAGAVMALDVDRFRAINDMLGPTAGDCLLQSVADRLRALTRSDDLAARIAGDDFAVILSGDDAGTRAEALARELTADAGRPYQVAAHSLVVGMTAGITTIEADDSDPLAVLQRAETALRRAKASGGNAVAVFDQAMAAGRAAAQQLEQELWEAHQRCQFEVFYQPVVDLASRRVTGCEALLRWRHPLRGLIAAGQFIPALETMGLMPVVGQAVLEMAAAAAATWPDDIGVAVNVSSVQFMRGNLCDAVGNVLTKTGLAPRRLTLEITESVFLGATQAVRATMSDLVALGVRFALDDFGTGYSSLAYVRNFPVSTLKIDRSFVVDLPSNEQAVAIVRAISVLAESLGMRVVAEGIDSLAQVRFLRLLGCSLGQGFLFGAAVPEREFAALLERQAAVLPSQRSTTL